MHVASQMKPLFIFTYSYLKIHLIVHYISTAIVLFSDEKIERIFLHILLKQKIYCVYLIFHVYEWLWFYVFTWVTCIIIMKCAIKDLKYMYSTGLNEECSVVFIYIHVCPNECWWSKMSQCMLMTNNININVYYTCLISES